MKAIRNFFARLFGKRATRAEPTAAGCDGLLLATMNDPGLEPALRAKAARAVVPYARGGKAGLAETRLVGGRASEQSIPRSRAQALAAVPRRAVVVESTQSSSDDGASLLLAAMFLNSGGDTSAPASCSRWDAPAGGGGSFDGGGASGNWDSGSSSSSDSYSSSDSGSSSSSFD